MTATELRHLSYIKRGWSSSSAVRTAGSLIFMRQFGLPNCAELTWGE